MALFVQILLQTPECSSGTGQYQHKVISYRSSRKTRAATTFMLSNPDLASKDDSTARLAYRWREVM
jgi:hypothetical protein